jgi:hypothetical protein
MATITVGDVTPRAQYTATSGQTVFAYTFPIFADGDLKVYIGSTLQTLTTHYTVSGAATSNGGNVTLVTGATAGDIVTIYRDIPVSRTSDYQASGDLLAETLNDDFDKTVMMAQQNEQSLSLGLRVNQFDDYGDMTLPSKDDRAGKVLAFNTTTGDPEGGPTIAATNTVADIAADIATCATNQQDIQIVAGDHNKITTLNSISSEMTSLAGLYSELYSLGTSFTVADINRLGSASIVADIATLADIEDGTLSTNAIQDVAAITTDVTTVATDVAPNITDVSTVADMATNTSKIFLYAVKRELGALLTLAPPVLDSHLYSWLYSNHTDGKPRGDLTQNGSITQADLSLHLAYLNNTANPADILTWNDRIGTPAPLDPTLYARYFDPNGVNPPLIEAVANIENINAVSGISSDITSLATNSAAITGLELLDELNDWQKGLQLMVLRDLVRIAAGATETDDQDLRDFLTATYSDGLPLGAFEGGTNGAIDTTDALYIQRMWVGLETTTKWDTRIVANITANSSYAGGGALYVKYRNTNIPWTDKFGTNSPWIAKTPIQALHVLTAALNSGALPLQSIDEPLYANSGDPEGHHMLVPHPSQSDISNNYVLRADGTWVAP